MNTNIQLQMSAKAAEETLVSYILHKNLLQWLIDDEIDPVALANTGYNDLGLTIIVE